MFEADTCAIYVLFAGIFLVCIEAWQAGALILAEVIIKHILVLHKEKGR